MILFLLKEHYNYSSYIGNSKSGLLNSIKFIVDFLRKEGIQTEFEICADGNSIDKFVSKYKPTVCFIEAIWVTPEKMKELKILHPKTEFIVRIHSKIPFLANEGMALTWIREYKREGIKIAYNNIHTFKELKVLKLADLYLPNIYKDKKFKKKCIEWFFDQEFKRPEISISSFGALRPLKNQVNQAVGALIFANEQEMNLKFHINGTRLEQGGENILKNLRALFRGTRHELIEHKWMNHEDFLKVVKEMDLGMQLSYSESFNIISADFVLQDVPIIVSEDIEWMPNIAKVYNLNAENIAFEIYRALEKRKEVVYKSNKALHSYNEESKNIWLNYLGYEI